MKSYQFKADSVEEAIRLARRELDAYEDELDIKIIEKGSKGFLGIFGTKESVIEVSLHDSHSERKLYEYLKGIRQLRRRSTSGSQAGWKNLQGKNRARRSPG